MLNALGNDSLDGNVVSGETESVPAIEDGDDNNADIDLDFTKQKKKKKKKPFK